MGERRRGREGGREREVMDCDRSIKVQLHVCRENNLACLNVCILHVCICASLRFMSGFYSRGGEHIENRGGGATKAPPEINPMHNT